MTELESSVNYTNEQIARICHEANRAMQIIQGDPAPSPPWDDAEEWQRTSAIEGVQQAIAGLSPADLHEQWCEFKRSTGWAFGPVKDAAAKTHPCLVAYADLDQGQKDKDAVFVAIVTALSGGLTPGAHTVAGPPTRTPETDLG
jgi:hypothetical protein